MRNLMQAHRRILYKDAVKSLLGHASVATTQVYVAVHPAVAGVSGEYFADCNVARPRPDAEDPAIAKRLWEVSEQIVAKL